MMTHTQPRQAYDAAYQGTHGAFSEDAALRMLSPDSRLLPCSQFEDVFESVHNGSARFGVVPIENTTAGSVHRIYDLLYEYDVTIVGETVTRIRHALVAPPGVALESVRKALSHPMALAQCEGFFRTHSRIEPIVAEDTAGAVDLILNSTDTACAAIASRRAAELRGAVVLLDGIQDDPDNYTRFLLISKPMEMVRPQSVEYKRTVVFRILNEPGALFRSLEPFAQRGIDMSKIETRPIPGTRFEYLYFLDLIGRPDYDSMYEALEVLRTRTVSMRVLGMYPRFKMFDNL